MSRVDDALAGAGREDELQSLTAGYQAAFGVAVGIAALGAVLALTLFRPRSPIEMRNR